MSGAAWPSPVSKAPASRGTHFGRSRVFEIQIMFDLIVSDIIVKSPSY